MESIRVLHTADWHIGRFPGPEKNGENMRFADICNCIDRLCDGAVSEKPDFVLVAGDVFHSSRTWSDRGIKEVDTAIRYIRRLSCVAPTIVMRGTPNHDGDVHFELLKTAFYGDSSVSIVTEPGIQLYTSYSGKKIQVACVPGFDRGYYRAKHPGLDAAEENEAFTKAVEEIINTNC